MIGTPIHNPNEGVAKIDPNSGLASSFANKLSFVESVHVNVAQPIIVTTEDKIHRCLSNHLECMAGRDGWIAPFSIFIATLTTLITCDFRDFVLGAAVWHATFLLATIMSFVWLCKSLLALRKIHSIEDVIHDIKEKSLEQQKP